MERKLDNRIYTNPNTDNKFRELQRCRVMSFECVRRLWKDQVGPQHYRGVKLQSIPGLIDSWLFSFQI